MGIPAKRSSKVASYNAAGEIIGAFLAARTPRTRLAYQKNLADFGAYIGAPSPGAALSELLAAGPGGAFRIVDGYKTSLGARGLAPATVNQRLSSLRELVKFARAAGLVNWTVEVENVKVQSYRDTRGPGREGVQLMLRVLDGRNDKKTTRDRALIRLLYDLALRRSEVVGLDVADVDLDAGVVKVRGKGRTQKEPLTLPEPTKAVLAAWLDVRGSVAGPLFLNFDRARKGERLTGEGIYYLVKTVSAKAGIVARPHGLRHAAITDALDKAGGDVRAVQKFSRHRDLRVLTIYDDTRQDLAGEVARLVASGVV